MYNKVLSCTGRRYSRNNHNTFYGEHAVKQVISAVAIFTFLAAGVALAEENAVVTNEPAPVTQPNEQQNGTSEPTAKLNNWLVKVHSRANPLGSPERYSGNLVFAVIGPVGNEWNVIGFSKTYPRRTSQKQDIFAVSRDLNQWQTVIEGWSADCGRGQPMDVAIYSVCNSELTKSDVTTKALGSILTFGVGLLLPAPKEFDADAVKKAVNSIPEEQAKAKFEMFRVAEAAELKARQEKQAKDMEATRAANAVKEAAENAKRESEMQNRANAPVGTKDFCEVQIKRMNMGFYRVLSDTFNCNTYGSITSKDVMNEGWIITNRLPRTYNNETIYDVTIEKVRLAAKK